MHFGALVHSAKIPLPCRLWLCGRSDGGWGGASLCSWKGSHLVSTDAGCYGAGSPSVATATGSCVLHNAPSFPFPGVPQAELVAAASQLVHKPARRLTQLQTVLAMWTKELAGNELASRAFYGPAEELKTSHLLGELPAQPGWHPALHPQG